MQSMRRLPLRIFNCQQFPLLLNFNFRRQFGLFQFLNKLQGNGKVTNLHHRLLQKQMASTFSLPSPAAVETLEFKGGKHTNFLNFEVTDGKNNAKYISLYVQVCTFHFLNIIKFSMFYLGFDKIGFLNIPLPEDAYSLVKAMDTLMSKFSNEEKPPIFHEFVKSSRPDFEDYKLEICPYKTGELKFWMKTTTTKSGANNQSQYSSEIFLFTHRVLPELRNRMAGILAKFDSAKQCGPCPSPLPKWVTAEKEEKDVVPQLQSIIRRESMKYSMNPAAAKPAEIIAINIEFKRGTSTSGKKWIQISQRNNNHKPRHIDFPKILVPEDGYNLLNGMIDLSNEFKKKEGELLNQGGHQEKSSSLICRQIVKGRFYDYKLEILHSHNSQQQQLEFRMETITTDGAPSHKPRKLYGPIHVFQWLQAQMAYSLAADLNTKVYGDMENIAEKEEDKSPLPLANDQ